MPINEIRDTIQGSVTTDAAGFGYLTRRINLPEGNRHSVLSIDVFNDNITGWQSNYPSGDITGTGYQLFVSPFPMQQTDETVGFIATGQLPGAGALAGDEEVLYKENFWTVAGEDFTNPNTTTKFFNCFPSKEVGAMPTFNWYSNHVFITVFVWNAPLTLVDVKHSLFMRIKQKKVGAAEESMGQYKEFLNAQCRLLTNTAVVYDPADVNGYVFPMWKYGGIRPELMISGTTALRYFNRVASNANQDMTTRNALQTAYRDATNMVGYDTAFGDAALNLPDWITLMDVSGVTAGELRPYPPPLKFADNGNTLMF